MAPAPERQLETLAVLRDPTRRRLYEFVSRRRGAASRDEAAEAVGIGRPLAAFHLDRLVAAGLLRTEYRRLSGRTGPGAGRTSKLYRRSRLTIDVTVPHREHELLARLLADVLAHQGDRVGNQRTDSSLGVLTGDVVEPAREYGRSLGKRARGRLRSRATPERLARCVEDVVETLGFEPYRESAAEVRLRNCPFQPLAATYEPLVCGIGQALLQGVVEGAGATQVAIGRHLGPDHCCGVLELTSSRRA